MKYRINQIKAPFIIFITLVITLHFCFVSYSYGQSFILNNGLKRDMITFTKAKNLIVIPILINGKGPYNFLLDTGVDPLIITNPALVDSLSLKNLRQVKINGVGLGQEINAFLSKEVKADIGEASIESIPTVILKEDVFNLSDYLGIKVYGIIGYYFFNSFVVKVNYQTNRLNFSLPNPKKKAKGVKLNLEFLQNKPYINTKLTTTNLGEIDAKLIIDCGASHALSLETYKDGAFPVPDPNISGNLGVGLSGTISGYISRVKKLTLGNVVVKDVLTNFPNYNDVAAKTNLKQRTGNLGADLLRHFHVTFDYQNSAMYLKKNDVFSEPFEHDMSGMEIYIHSGDYNRFFINRIETDSQAEKAGIKPNDEILSINFKDVSVSSLDEITNLFKSSSGRTVIIEVVRDGQIFIKLLTLKKRV